MLIDYRDSRPIYEQIADGYRRLILAGALAPDEQLPSVRTLAMELSANPNTVQRAYAELERQGYMYSVKGRGNYVCHADALRRMRAGELADKIAGLILEAEEIGTPRDVLMRSVDEALARRADRGGAS